MNSSASSHSSTPTPTTCSASTRWGAASVVRALRPGAAAVRVVPARGKPVELALVDPAGLFEGVLPRRKLPLAYRLEVDYVGGETVSLVDPFAFPPTLGELDLHLIAEGRHEELYEKLGAHPRELDGIAGVSFALWAPNARSVSIVGDFNGWDGRLHPMRSLGAAGVWEIFVPGVEPGSRYKYEVRGRDGTMRLKADPLAFAAERAPATASIVERPTHLWADKAWLERRSQARPFDGPLSIYEVHLGSWRRDPLEGIAASPTSSSPRSSPPTRSTSVSRTSS